MTDLVFAAGHLLPNTMYHYGARFYDPSLARWTQEDPLAAVASQQNANRYAYVGGNPVNGADLAGLKSLRDYAKACGGGAIGGAIEGPADIGAGCATGAAAEGIRDIGERTGCGERCDYVAIGLDVAGGGRSIYKGLSKHGGKLIVDATDSLITGLGL